MTSGGNNFNDFPEKSTDQIYSRIWSNEEIKIEKYMKKNTKWHT